MQVLVDSNYRSDKSTGIQANKKSKLDSELLQYSENKYPEVELSPKPQFRKVANYQLVDTQQTSKVKNSQTVIESQDTPRLFTNNVRFSDVYLKPQTVQTPKKAQSEEKIKVVIRIRPITNSEAGQQLCVQRQDQHHIEARSGAEYYNFNFDHVAGPDTTQDEFFKLVGRPIVENSVAGYNSCVMAFGQTGSGKTHTMLGEVPEQIYQYKEQAGLIPRIFNYLLWRISQIENRDSGSTAKFSIKCSYLEIYQEVVTDLLNPQLTKLTIREDVVNGRTYVEGLSSRSITNVQDVISLLKIGAGNRHMAETKLNKESSRSHCILVCDVVIKISQGDITNIRKSCIHLVDLAGSERQKPSNTYGSRLKEATYINKSLSTLGMVIMKLEQGASHVPYRDSKLTFLLQNSLGGNAKTVLIANLSPIKSSFNESNSTLGFAHRAKSVKLKATVNEDTQRTSPDPKTSHQQMMNQLQTLTQHLLQMESSSQIPSSNNSSGSRPMTPSSYLMNFIQMSEQQQAQIQELQQQLANQERSKGEVRHQSVIPKQDKVVKSDIKNNSSLLEEIQRLQALLQQKDQELLQLNQKLAKSAASNLPPDHQSGVKKELFQLQSQNQQINQDLQHYIYKHKQASSDLQGVQTENKLLGQQITSAWEEIDNIKKENQKQSNDYYKYRNENLKLKKFISQIALDFSVNVTSLFPRVKDYLDNTKQEHLGNSKGLGSDLEAMIYGNNLDVGLEIIQQGFNDVHIRVKVLDQVKEENVRQNQALHNENQHLHNLYKQMTIQQNQLQDKCRNLQLQNPEQIIGEIEDLKGKLQGSYNEMSRYRHNIEDLTTTNLDQKIELMMLRQRQQALKQQQAKQQQQQENIDKPINLKSIEQLHTHQKYQDQIQQLQQQYDSLWSQLPDVQKTEKFRESLRQNSQEIDIDIQDCNIEGIQNYEDPQDVADHMTKQKLPRTQPSDEIRANRDFLMMSRSQSNKQISINNDHNITISSNDEQQFNQPGDNTFQVNTHGRQSQDLIQIIKQNDFLEKVAQIIPIQNLKDYLTKQQDACTGQDRKEIVQSFQKYIEQLQNVTQSLSQSSSRNLNLNKNQQGQAQDQDYQFYYKIKQVVTSMVSLAQNCEQMQITQQVNIIERVLEILESMVDQKVRQIQIEDENQNADENQNPETVQQLRKLEQEISNQNNELQPQINDESNEFGNILRQREISEDKELQTREQSTNSKIKNQDSYQEQNKIQDYPSTNPLKFIEKKTSSTHRRYTPRDSQSNSELSKKLQQRMLRVETLNEQYYMYRANNIMDTQSYNTAQDLFYSTDPNVYDTQSPEKQITMHRQNQKFEINSKQRQDDNSSIAQNETNQQCYQVQISPNNLGEPQNRKLNFSNLQAYQSTYQEQDGYRDLEDDVMQIDLNSSQPLTPLSDDLILGNRSDVQIPLKQQIRKSDLSQLGIQMDPFELDDQVNQQGSRRNSPQLSPNSFYQNYYDKFVVNSQNQNLQSEQPKQLSQLHSQHQQTTQNQPLKECLNSKQDSQVYQSVENIKSSNGDKENTFTQSQNQQLPIQTQLIQEPNSTDQYSEVQNQIYKQEQPKSLKDHKFVQQSINSYPYIQNLQDSNYQSLGQPNYFVSTTSFVPPTSSKHPEDLSSPQVNLFGDSIIKAHKDFINSTATEQSENKFQFGIKNKENLQMQSQNQQIATESIQEADEVLGNMLGNSRENLKQPNLKESQECIDISNQDTKSIQGSKYSFILNGPNQCPSPNTRRMMEENELNSNANLSQELNQRELFKKKLQQTKQTFSEASQEFNKQISDMTASGQLRHKLLYNRDDLRSADEDKLIEHLDTDLNEENSIQESRKKKFGCSPFKCFQRKKKRPQRQIQAIQRSKSFGLPQYDVNDYNIIPPNLRTQPIQNHRLAHQHSDNIY